MYKRVLLAFDGSVEGRRALREGAMIARRCGAQVYLLSVVPDTMGFRVAEGVHAGAVALEQRACRATLDEGAARLRQLGFDPVTRLMSGDPAAAISGFAAEVAADLVVVGHRRQNALSRWWSGASGAYLVDFITCSLLIVRDGVSDAAFEAEVAAASASAEVRQGV